MVSLIDDAYIHPGLSDLHDEAAGNEIRPERFWKQLSNLSNAIIKVVIDEAMMEQLLYPALGNLFWVLFHDFFLIWKITLFQEVNILVYVSYHALLWTCGYMYLPKYDTQYWH